MTAAEIRDFFLGFFEARDHRRVPSASLVPAALDPSVLLTTAGMQPFKPYFRGEEPPPWPRLTSSQKVFRTTDIENVGLTARHLTFFEMLGNFSFGDYFKAGAVDHAWTLSREGFGFDAEHVWITVFGGDEVLGLGPDEEAIACWRGVGVPDERIVRLGREDNFWQAGPTGPCGPCSELYLDRGLGFGSEGDRPGDDTERFLEYWNLVFMQYELGPDASLTPLPKQNIDTGLGLERLAAILQGVPSVFETDLFRPLVSFGEERSGRRYGDDPESTRALRILADHGRGMTMLLSDGVVPSNEDRGYILRRIMRRAIEQGRRLGIEGPFLPALCERVTDTMGDAYPALHSEAQAIRRWAAAEEEGFARTLVQGERLLEEMITSAEAAQTSWVPAADAFRLHDTYGFPYELTKELLAERGLSVDDSGFEELMDRARETARRGGRRGTPGGGHDEVVAFAARARRASHFVGYEALAADTVVAALEPADGRLLAKLEESPFYPEGGGQVSDAGLVETDSSRARVTAVYRVGDDQVLGLQPERGELEAGQAARAVVDRPARLATMCNHTATHLLHAALRERLGAHVRQAGSYVGPDKLRFDFTHGQRLSPEEIAAVEERVNGWIVENHPVRAVETTRAEAESMGAMALFGEKYGDVVRMVEVEDVSRELCGGTHVSTTAEIGVFRLTSETSSAANVRRIEALSGAAGVASLRHARSELAEAAAVLRATEDGVAEAARRLTEREREQRQRRPKDSSGPALDSLVEAASELDGVKVVTEVVELPDAKTLLEVSDTVRQRLGTAAVVLGCAVDGRVHLVANFAPAAVERGARAGEVIRAAGAVVGGGGGGRDTMAQAGGRDPGKLPDAIAAARIALQASLTG